MLLHINTRRNIALDLLQRGLVTQGEAAKLLGESRQGVKYLSRDIDPVTARANYLHDLWRSETAKPRKVTRKKLTLRKKDVQQ
jgi:predicted transcriptional regulator